MTGDERAVNDPTNQQIKKSLGKLEEKHHEIMFVYKADRQRYG